MMKLNSALAAAAFCVLTASTSLYAAGTKLIPYETSYSASLSGVPISGNAKRTLRQNQDGSWTLSFRADMLIYSFDEESRFRFSSGKIQPESYSLEKGSFGRKRTSAVQFDWGTKFANSERDKKSWKIPLVTNDLDKISYQQQLQYDLSAGLKSFSYAVIDKDEREAYTFQIDGQEVIDTPVGKLDTVRLKMVRDNNKRQTWIWLAKDWSDLLVKLKQTEKGKDYIVTLEDGTVGGKAIQGKTDAVKPK